MISLDLGDTKSVNKAIELMENGVKGRDVSWDIKNGEVSKREEVR